MITHQCYYVAIQGQVELRCPREAEIVLRLSNEKLYFCERHMGIVAMDAEMLPDGDDQDESGVIA